MKQGLPVDTWVSALDAREVTVSASKLAVHAHKPGRKNATRMFFFKSEPA